MKTLRVGIVGCGNISGIYFRNLTQYPATEVVAAADLDLARAEKACAEFGVPRALSPEALLADPEVDLVLNLTVPKAHADIARRSVEAGKHVYNEKPLTVWRQEAIQLLALADAKGVRVGSAPDTFLGAGHQTARAAIDAGMIGEPIAAQANMLCHGHESWHPSPEFYYEVGGGPMLDMGPYYLTALVNMMGPVRRVTGSTRITFPTRTITSQPKAGKVIEVEAPTHYAGILDFASGAIGEITTSFDIWASRSPIIAVYGTEGTLLVPDPNGFGGEVLVAKAGSHDFAPIPSIAGLAENGRGTGVLDMAYAIAEGRPHRASGRLATHVLDIMQGIDEASKAGRHLELETTCDRPAALRADELALG